MFRLRIHSENSGVFELPHGSGSATEVRPGSAACGSFRLAERSKHLADSNGPAETVDSRSAGAHPYAMLATDKWRVELYFELSWFDTLTPTTIPLPENHPSQRLAPAGIFSRGLLKKPRILTTT